MSLSKIEKTLLSQEITEEQLTQIGNYTRRPMQADELFVFSILLCDNEIDRDGERFPKKSLERLASLYLGKTGVFDHVAKAEHQSARIFHTEIVESGKNSLGKDYYALKAWAYMVRCPKNEDFILEIDAGIKKEVSVGCAVEQVVCSICGKNMKLESCNHIKGAIYQNETCHHLLLNPTDAYEWSFVAVPAQKNAGVTKQFNCQTSYSQILEKLQKSMGNVSLTREESQVLQKELSTLTELSKAGQQYVIEIQKDIVRTASMVQPEIDAQVLEDVCKQMSLEQLKSFQKSYQTLAKKENLAYTLQLQPASIKTNTTQQSFKI